MVYAVCYLFLFLYLHASLATERERNAEIQESERKKFTEAGKKKPSFDISLPAQHLVRDMCIHKVNRGNSITGAILSLSRILGRG